MFKEESNDLEVTTEASVCEGSHRFLTSELVYAVWVILDMTLEAARFSK
jgi:hypothetical protein